MATSSVEVYRDSDGDGPAEAYLLARPDAGLGLLAWPDGDDGRRGEPIALGSLLSHAVADWRPVPEGEGLPAVVREGVAALAAAPAPRPGEARP